MECVSSRYGVKCVWNKKKESCETFSADVKKNSLELCDPSQEGEPAAPRNTSLECSLQVGNSLELVILVKRGSQPHRAILV